MSHEGARARPTHGSQMSCRRAFDVDLADFVAGSTRPEWAEFRAHYARCAECSAEVRAWTELHLLLQAPAAHPAEAVLLRFETEPGRLPAAERRVVEEHLARCPSCRDELAALRRFDFAALEPKAAVAPAPRPSFAERIRRLVVHPGFAYAIVLLLLYPALEGRLRSPAGQAAREDRHAVADRPAGKLPVPDAARSGDVEVRGLDARGGREMRERFARAAERVAMQLPAAWLTPGTYTAELRRLDTGPSPAEVFSFRVVP